MKHLNEISMMLARAARAGDEEKVELCTKALDGEPEALEECSRLLAEELTPCFVDCVTCGARYEITTEKATMFSQTREGRIECEGCALLSLAESQAPNT